MRMESTVIVRMVMMVPMKIERTVIVRTVVMVEMKMKRAVMGVLPRRERPKMVTP